MPLGKKKDDRMKKYLIEKHEMKEIRTRDEILGHRFDKKLEYFARYFSQSLLLPDLTETILYSSFKNTHTQKKIRETKKLESIHEWHL
jgi:hypothetical protein